MQIIELDEVAKE